MGKSKAFRAAIARRRAAKVQAKHAHKKAFKPGKERDKILNALRHCCIPKKVENPSKGYDDAVYETYDIVHAEWMKWRKANYSERPRAKRKTPWYTMPGGKRLYNYETRTKAWGMQTDYFRVPSPASIYHERTIGKKMTHEEYKERLIEAKLADWVKKNPRPVPKNDAQKDLFEAQFMVPWVQAHTEAREKIVKFVENIGNRVKVFARYERDTGPNMYPTKIMELRSDGKPLIEKSGYYNNQDSSVVRKVQRAANALSKQDPSLIALKIVDMDHELIVVPKAA